MPRPWSEISTLNKPSLTLRSFAVPSFAVPSFAVPGFELDWEESTGLALMLMVEPLGENFKALESKLTTTWVIRSESM